MNISTFLSAFQNKASEETTLSDVEDDLFVRPIKAKRVKKNTSAVCRYYGDIALVLYRKEGDLEETGQESYSWVDRDDVFEWHATEEEAIETALYNTSSSEEDRAIVLNAYDLHGFDGLQLADDYSFTDVPEGIILSTKCVVNGAAAAFYPGMLEKIAKQLESDLLIMFPSQCIAIVYSEKSLSADDLQSALNLAIKEEGYKKSCHLSKHIFRYVRETKELNTV